MNIFAAITTALKVLQATWALSQYLDEIKTLVLQAENYFPETGNGAKRLRWVRQQLEQSIVIRDKLDKYWPKIDLWISNYVAKVVNKRS